MDMTREEQERTLIEAFSKDAGVRVGIPDDPAGRWALVRSLMNVRMPAPVDPGVMMAHDDYMASVARSRPVTDADDLEFRDGMCVWKGDITTLRCDAIVNAANSGMLGCFVPCHRCIDNAIHSYAGIRLRMECAEMMGGMQEPAGRARITGAYNLPCRRIIHTVGPVVDGPLTDAHRDLLRSCYRSCLELARSEGLRTVAFCCISTGEYRFPNRPAAEIAVDEVRRFLSDHDGMRVIFDVFKEEDHGIYRELLG